MKLAYIKPSAVKRYAKTAHSKRISKEFLAALDKFVEEKVRAAAEVHNGGKKTIDASVAAFVLGPR